MAISWRREQRPNLETKPWKVLSLGTRQESKEYLIKAVFEEIGYHVMVSDGCAIWEENMDSKKVLERLKDLNPSVEAPLSILQSALSSHLDAQQNAATYSITFQAPLQTSEAIPTSMDCPWPAGDLQPIRATLSIQTTLSSLPLDWQFVCTRCRPEKMSTHLVFPLFSMVGELCRRQLRLCQILARKDKELQDFGEQGYTVSRKYLKTELFMPSAFENEMITSAEFEGMACQDLQVLATSDCQRLYRDVAMARRWSRNKEDFPPEEPPCGGLETAGTWEAKIPSSMLPTVPLSRATPTCTSNITPLTTSHDKGTGPVTEDVSPSKDMELCRREALEKKLEKEMSKTKRKKKRLM